MTVAIPVYDGEAYLPEAIRSVLSQSYTGFELIICDDHSRDSSVAIAEAFGDPRIRVLRHDENLGIGGNWNRCLAAARGKYIKILPQDDLLHPECLEKQVQILEQDGADALSLVFCRRSIIDAGGKVLLQRGLRGQAARFTGEQIARLTARSGTNPVGEPGAVLFRRTAAEAAGAFNGGRPFVIDIDYWLRLLKFGDAAFIPDVLASFRVSSGSLSVRMARRQASEFSAFLDDMSEIGLYALGWPERRMGALAASMNAVGRAMFYRRVIGKRGES